MTYRDGLADLGKGVPGGGGPVQMNKVGQVQELTHNLLDRLNELNGLAQRLHERLLGYDGEGANKTTGGAAATPRGVLDLHLDMLRDLHATAVSTRHLLENIGAEIGA